MASALAALGLVLASACQAAGQAAEPSETAAASQDETPVVDLGVADLAPYRFEEQTGVVVRRSLLRTVRPDRPRFEVVEYTVQAGDTPWSIGEEFGVRPETILWGNPSLSARSGDLSIGITLKVLPVDGVLHEVQEGETLDSI
ncbi:MAG TPA: LysM domain-containing protein, partial [Anaerolineales bacterium]